MLQLSLLKHKRASGLQVFEGEVFLYSQWIRKGT